MAAITVINKQKEPRVRPKTKKKKHFKSSFLHQGCPSSRTSFQPLFSFAKTGLHQDSNQGHRICEGMLYHLGQQKYLKFLLVWCQNEQPRLFLEWKIGQSGKFNRSLRIKKVSNTDPGESCTTKSLAWSFSSSDHLRRTSSILSMSSGTHNRRSIFQPWFKNII